MPSWEGVGSRSVQEVSPSYIYVTKLYLINIPSKALLLTLSSGTLLPMVLSLKAGFIDKTLKCFLPFILLPSAYINYGKPFFTIIFNILNFGYQLKISDVHFRYEDDLTVPGSGVVLGLQIESLTAHSCDESWTVGAVSKDKTNCFKLLQLNNLGVYWDNVPLDQLLGDLSIPELSVILLILFCISINVNYKLLCTFGHT